MSHSANGAYRSRGHRRASRAKRWIIVVACIAVLGAIAYPVLNYFDVFSDKGEAISFGQENKGGGGQAGGDTGGSPNSKVLMPTGPEAKFTIANTVPEDGTKIAVTTLDGKKSGFKGKVWVWVPKIYKDDPKYANSGFPVLIALPGGAGYPINYWMGTDMKLQASITKWAEEKRGLPFIVAMPVLNPHPDNGVYNDASDIPGQQKMGTWLTEDVPDLIKANFRTVKSRDGWAFMGSSTGAFAGLKSVLQKPDKFKAVIASGPDIVPDSPLWNGHEKEKQENNPEVLAKKLIARKGPDVYLAFQYGSKEGSVKGKVDKFIATYGNKGPIHSHLQVIEGGTHNGETYVKGMDMGSMEWISKHLQGPVPAS